MANINTFSDFNIAFDMKPAKTAAAQPAVINAEKKDYLDAFIKENEKQAKKENQKIGYLRALGRCFTFGFPFIPFAAYETYAGVKMFHSMKKLPKMDRMPLIENYLKQFIPLYAGVLALTYGLFKIGALHSDLFLEREKQKVEKFNKANNTNIKFYPLSNSSGSIAGGMNPMSGTLSVDAAMAIDPVMRLTYLPATVDHELVHANQYLMIARLDNAMEKMNLVIVKRIAKSMGFLPKFVIGQMKKEIDCGISEKYQNAKISLEGCEVKLVDYVNAIYTAIHNPNCTEKDVPVIINKEFYENAQKLGPLSEEEKKKAEAYLDAYENYPLKISLLPNSQYRRNLLEKEAFAVTPWYFI